MIIAQRRRYKTNDRAPVERPAGVARTKLEALRAYADRNPLPGNIQAVADLEKSIKRAELYANFLNHPVTKEIAMKLVKQIEVINSELLAGVADPKVQHDTIIRRDEWKAMLSLFSPARANEGAVASYIDTQIQAFRDYYGE